MTWKALSERLQACVQAYNGNAPALLEALLDLHGFWSSASFGTHY